MKIGFDADNTETTVCDTVYWEKKNIGAGLLLYAYGTAPVQHAVFTTGCKEAVKYMKRRIEEQIVAVYCDDGAADVQYAAAKIMDVFQECNSQIYEMKSFLGQGIYIGGAVAYTVGSKYILFPFGGGRAYIWNGVIMMPQGDPPAADGIIRDAVGAMKTWPGQCWTGTLLEDSRLILTSSLLPKLDFPEFFRSDDNSHVNTPAMRLRRELEKINPEFSAVVDIHNNREEAL